MLMKKELEGLIRKKYIRELIKYGLVGVVGLVIDMGVYYLLVDKYAVEYAASPFFAKMLSVVGLGLSFRIIDILISNVISSTLAIINNFILNSYFTFKVTDKKFKRFSSFFGVAAIGIVVSSMLLTLFIDVIGIGEMPAKVIAVCIVAMMQFIINKLFTFR